MNIHSSLQGKQIIQILLITLFLSFICTACGEKAPATKEQSRQATTTRATVLTAIPTTRAMPLATGQIVYVALGASDAVGVGADQPATQGYVPQIFQHLPQGSHLINLGSSGIHLHEALTQELPIAVASNPQLITIWLVANDFVAGVAYDSYMQDLNSMLQQLHSETSARVVMANLPDLTLLPFFNRDSPQQKQNMQAAIQRWNTQIAVLAQQYDVVLVDLTTHNSQLTAHPEYVSGDGFHPSPAGYTQLANFFWDAIM
jgi:acyl-CoA thioesterase I